MNKNRMVKGVGLGVLGLSVGILAQQNLPNVPAPSEARPNFGSVVPRTEGAMPKVPAGFTVQLYADNVPGARLMEFASNGDLFVSQPAQNAVMVLRDTNKDGMPDERFTYAQGPPPVQRGAPPAASAAGPGGPGGGRGPAANAPAEMIQPFGLAFHEGYLYVGNTNSIVRYKYTPGDTKAAGPPEKLRDLNGGANHFTRNIIFSRDGKKLYVSVGST